MRIVIIAAVRLYREGLADVLRHQGTFTVTGTAGSGPAGVECVRRHRPDLVLVDSTTPGGVGILTQLRAVAPQSRVVVLGVAEDVIEIVACVEAGAAGYVPRDGSIADLIATLERAGRGEAVCPPAVLAGLLHRVAEMTGGGGFLESGELTSRELQIVALIENGLTNREIADRLSMAPSTVKNHIHNIFDKLQIRRRAEAAAWARRHRDQGRV
ncbi:DNA-binding NarL/FixJ family response regulator [Actinoplanes lutulentus]|nr:response regulator transcription factor [Actinoplanes lutulentus]MBB2948505.1 DNA-binding NarL/FixJ family response regulator [Actinoplanes lutulentus]